MRRGQAATGHDDAVDLPRQQAAVGDVVGLPVGEVLPACVAAGVVLLDRRPAAGHGVGELPRRQDVVAGQPVRAMDAAALADPDLGGEAAEVGALVAGDAVAQEAAVLERLAPALALRARELLGVGGVDAGDARHVRVHHVGEGRDVGAPLAPGEVVVAAVGRLVHAGPQLGLREGARRIDVDVDHPEGGGQRLGGPVGAGVLEGSPGTGHHVGVARRVDHGPSLDGAQPLLGGDHRAGHAVAILQHVDEGDVVQHLHAGLPGQLVPHQLERVGVVGVAGAGAVGVRPLQHHAAPLQAGDDPVGHAAHHLALHAPGREEAVEGVEHHRAGAAEEAVALDQQDVGALLGGGHRRAGAGRSAADHQHVAGVGQRHAPGELDAPAHPATLQPPATSRTVPVTKRASSEAR